MKKVLFLGLLFVGVLGLNSCKKDDPKVENEEEVITTLNYKLTPENGGETVTLSFQDLDGDGGNAPVINGGTIKANTRYEGAITLLNEAESPAENITEEIEEEDKDHQFFFASNASGISVSYNDKDGDDNPIGLATILSTGDATSGSITITLRHEPNKGGEGVSTGNIANAGGETDIEVTLPVTVE